MARLSRRTNVKRTKIYRIPYKKNKDRDWGTIKIPATAIDNMINERLFQKDNIDKLVSMVAKRLETFFGKVGK